MDLKNILAIGGKPGLFKILSQTRSGWVVQSLIDGKRAPIFSHDKVSSLEEISIYTDFDETPLKQVFANIFKHSNGEKTISHKSSAADLRSFFLEVLPDYDEDRVYTSDIKKVVSWYNLLVEKDIINQAAVDALAAESDDADSTEVSEGEA